MNDKAKEIFIKTDYYLEQVESDFWMSEYARRKVRMENPEIDCKVQEVFDLILSSDCATYKNIVLETLRIFGEDSAEFQQAAQLAVTNEVNEAYRNMRRGEGLPDNAVTELLLLALKYGYHPSTLGPTDAYTIFSGVLYGEKLPLPALPFCFGGNTCFLRYLNHTLYYRESLDFTRQNFFSEILTEPLRYESDKPLKKITDVEDATREFKAYVHCILTFKKLFNGRKVSPFEANDFAENYKRATRSGYVRSSAINRALGLVLWDKEQEIGSKKYTIKYGEELIVRLLKPSEKHTKIYRTNVSSFLKTPDKTIRFWLRRTGQCIDQATVLNFDPKKAAAPGGDLTDL